MFDPMSFMASLLTGQDDALKPWTGIPKIHRPVLWMEWSDMFVLMSLMCSCLQRTTVLFVGLHRPSAPIRRAQPAI